MLKRSPLQRYTRRANSKRIGRGVTEQAVTMTEEGRGSTARTDRMTRQKVAMPDVPWLQATKTSYFEDAQLRYGRKETWADIEDLDTKRMLLLITRKYLYDTAREAAVFRTQAKRASLSAKRLTAVLDMHIGPQDEGMYERVKHWTHPERPTGPVAPDTAEVEEPKQPQRAEASSPPPRQVGQMPFLRTRALDDPDSLDPALQHFAATHYPEDSLERIRGDQPSEAEDESPAMTATEQKSPQKNARPPRHKGGLAATLQDVQRELVPTFDAEGVYYAVRPDGGKPRGIKMRRSGHLPKNIVKSDWATLGHIGRDGPLASAARERWTRQGRGEDVDK